MATYVVLRLQKKQVQREVKQKIIAGISNEELILLKFTEKEKQTQLNWKHSKEFEHKGETYDIVKASVVGDTTYYWVWWDHEETKLNKQLSRLVSIALDNDPKNQENQKRLQHFFKSLYFVGDNRKDSFVLLEVKNEYYTGQKSYHSVFHTPPIPPPKES